jgi:membrane AbrB-like protein
LGRLPWPVTAVAYLVAGLSVGGRFRRSTIIAAKQLLLPLFATSLLLFCTSFILAYVLVRQTGLDAVSAFLAATPGILESVGAVAAEVQGDSTMILSVHILRLACVVIAAPWLVRAARKWLVKRGQSRA